MNMPKRKVIVYGLLIFVVSLIIIVMMAAPSKNILSTIRSGSDDEQIQSLSSRIKELSGNEKFWHDAYLWFIGAAILVSIVLFFVQHHEASLAKERADAESELNRVKDRKLTREISAADERAGKANERAAALESETAQSRVLIANAQADAAKAAERAALAELHLAESNAQAKLAEQHAKEADAKAESFRLDIARATEGTAKLELEVAAQRERAAKAESELLALQNRLRPREITAQQRASLISRLAAIPKREGQSITIDCVLGDSEGKAFAVQVDEALKAAGFSTSGVNQSVYSPSNPVGFGMLVKNAGTPPAAAGPIQQAFISVGLQMDGVADPKMNDDAIRILVGIKPQGR